MGRTRYLRVQADINHGDSYDIGVVFDASV